MSKFIKVTVKSTGLPLVINTDRIESMIPLDGYTSIRMAGSVLGAADHVLESIKEIESQMLRDEFAKAALTGLISDANISIENAAEIAYRTADAMLKERTK